MNIVRPANPQAAPARPERLPQSAAPGGDGAMAGFAYAMDLAGMVDAALLAAVPSADGEAAPAETAAVPPQPFAQDLAAAAALTAVPGPMPAVPAAPAEPQPEEGAEGAAAMPAFVPESAVGVAAGSHRSPAGTGIAARLAALSGLPGQRPGDAPAGLRPVELPAAVQRADAVGSGALPLPGLSPAKPEGDVAPAAEPAPILAAAAPAAGTSPSGGAPAPAAVAKLPAGAPEQWRSPLLEALGERIRFELGNRGEQAVIRLDPPMLGSVEVVIRHQAGMLQVQLSASNGEVVRQLQSISGSLHQDLSQRQYTDVSVQVFADARDGGGRQDRNPSDGDRRPGRALAEAEAGQPASSFLLSHDRV